MLKTAKYKLGGRYDYEIEDIVSDSYIKIVNNIEKIKFDNKAQLRGYVMTIVKNTAIDFLKSRDPNLQNLDDCEAELVSEDNFIEQFNIMEDYNETIGFIRKLPDRYRVAIELRYLHELDVDQIAKQLDVPVATAYTRITRGRNLLWRMREQAHNKKQ